MFDNETPLAKGLKAISSLAFSMREESTLRQQFIEAVDQFLDQAGLSNRGIMPRLDERIIKGRSDARIGGLVFEVKLPEPRGEGVGTAIAQVKRYILEHRQHGESVRGIAYDGHNIAFIDENCRMIQQCKADQDVTTLESWLIVLGGRAITPEDAINRLGMPSPTARDFIKSLWEIFKDTRQEIGFVDEAYRIWEGLYGCATNLNAEALNGVRNTAKALGVALRSDAQIEHFLFALETYLAILLKLLVARVTVQQRLIPYTSVSSLLYPKPSARFAELEVVVPQLAGVFEHDSFSWFYDAARTNRDIEGRLDVLINKTVEAVDDVDLTGLSRDFLRVFYQRFFDPSTRRALGEFYTSTKLVNETLDTAGYDGSLDKLIADISCGSGTFVIGAITRAISKNMDLTPHEVLQGITGKIIGIDIHPFAVAMARVNYILAISELLTPQTLQLVPQVRIPIFWADSLARLVPEHDTADLSAFGVTIDIHIPGLGNFKLPNPRDLSWDNLFDTLRRLLSSQMGQVNLKDFWKRFTQEFQERDILRFENTLRDFVKNVVERHNDQRDMRWLPLLRNVLAMEQIRSQCDYIVGNPPWVRIHNIEEGLRDRLFNTYQFYINAGWKRGCELGDVGRGFARQADLAMAFIERGLELLKKGGTLAFVITSKIQQALYANSLRSHLVLQTRLRKLVDYSLYAQPLFEDATNYPLIFALDKIKPSSEHKLEVTVYNIHGDKIDYSICQKDLSLLRDDPESPWMIAPINVAKALRKMQNCNIVLGMKESIRPRMGIKTSLNRVFIVDRIEATDSPDEVLAITEDNETIRIEKSLLRPMIRGENLDEWRYSTKQYIIWTHDDETGVVYSELPPKAKNYFEKHTKALENRDGYKDSMPIWTIFRVNPAKLGKKVAWQSLSKMMGASYIPALHTDQVLGTVKLIPIQTLYLMPVDTEQKAYMLTGILNSLPVRCYLSSFAERARGAYFMHIAWTVSLLPIPKALDEIFEERYITGENDHQSLLDELAEVSKKLHSNIERRERLQLESKLNEIVALIYNLDKNDMMAIENYYHFVHGTKQMELKLDG